MIHVYRSVNVDEKKLFFDTYEVIFYEQPNPKRLQFLALDPLELDISSTDMNITKTEKPLTKKQLEELSNLKKIIDYGHMMNHETEPESDDLGIVLVQINSSYFLEHGMKLLVNQHKRKNAPRYPTLDRITRSLYSFSHSLVQTTITNPKGFIGYHVKKIIVSLFLSILFLILALAEVTLHALSVRLPKFILNGVAFKDLFAAGMERKKRLFYLFIYHLSLSLSFFLYI